MWVGQMAVVANMMHNPTQPRQRASMASWQSGLGRSSQAPAPTKLFSIIVKIFANMKPMGGNISVEAAPLRGSRAS